MTGAARTSGQPPPFSGASWVWAAKMPDERDRVRERIQSLRDGLAQGEFRDRVYVASQFAKVEQLLLEAPWEPFGGAATDQAVEEARAILDGLERWALGNSAEQLDVEKEERSTDDALRGRIETVLPAGEVSGTGRPQARPDAEFRREGKSPEKRTARDNEDLAEEPPLMIGTRGHGRPTLKDMYLDILNEHYREGVLGTSVTAEAEAILAQIQLATSERPALKTVTNNIGHRYHELKSRLE